MGAVTISKTGYPVDAGGTVIGGILSQSVNMGSSVRSEISSGGTYAEALSMTSQKPTTQFSTRSVGVAIGALGLTFSNIATLGYLKQYARKRAVGGGWAASGHTEYHIANGVIIPSGLSVSHQEDASIEYRAMAIWDGTNAPVVVSHSGTLPTWDADDESFSIGPVSVGGQTIDHVRSIGVEFTHDAVTEGADSEVWDSVAAINGMTFKITLGGIDVEWFTQSGTPIALTGTLDLETVPAGKVCTAANTEFYLRKHDDGGTFVSDATAEHLKFVADGIAVPQQLFDSSGNATGECNLEIYCKTDGTNAPIQVTVGSAIT